MPYDFLIKLIGQDLPVQFLELDEKSLEKLDNDLAVKILSNNNLVKYRNMQAFTLREEHKNLLVAIRMALGIKEDLKLPLVVIRKGSSVIPTIHELTHAVRLSEKKADPQNIHDYIRSSEEQEAFVNSIIVYRYLNPLKSFYDFVREQESADPVEFPDHYIAKRIESGKGKHLGIEQRMWKEIDDITKTGKDIESFTNEIKNIVLNKIKDIAKDEVLYSEKSVIPVVIIPEGKMTKRSQESKSLEKIEKALKIQPGEKGIFLYHEKIYSNDKNNAPKKSAFYNTEFVVLNIKHDKDNEEVWIKIKIIKAINESYYGLEPIAETEQGWIRITAETGESFPIKIAVTTNTAQRDIPHVEPELPINNKSRFSLKSL